MDYSSNSIIHTNKSNDSMARIDEINVELTYTQSSGDSGNVIKKKLVNIPIHSILLREIEMQETSVKFSIHRDQWNGSLLYRKWQENGDRIFIGLDEECMALRKDVDEKTGNFTSTCLFTNNFIWDDWCIDLIEKFYSSGKLHIPHNVLGYDFLLLIELFGILYQPDQLVYESYSAFINVRHWSNYFTNRMAMSCWIADYIDHFHNDRKSKIIERSRFEFATSLTPDKELVSLDNVLLPVIGQSDKKVNSSRFAVLDYDYFNGVSNVAKVSCISIETANLMQDDFVMFLRHNLSHTIQDAKFVPMEVTIRNTENVAAVTTRAILVVEILTSTFNEPTQEKEAIDVHETVTEVLVADPIINYESESREPPPTNMTTITEANGADDKDIETIVHSIHTSSKVVIIGNEKHSLSNETVSKCSQQSPRGIADIDFFQVVPLTRKDDDDEEQTAVGSVENVANQLNVQDDEQVINLKSIPNVDIEKKDDTDTDLSENDGSNAQTRSSRKVVFEVAEDLLATVAPGDTEIPSPFDFLDGKQFDLVTVPSALTTSFTVYDTDNLKVGNRESPGAKPAIGAFVRSLFNQENYTSDQAGRWDWLVEMNACQFPHKLMDNMRRCSASTNATVRDLSENEIKIPSDKVDPSIQKNVCQMDEQVSIDVVHVEGLPSDEVRTEISIIEIKPENEKKEVKDFPTIKHHLNNVQNKINEGKLQFVRSTTR
jgi:hypothetical protein